ncbi:hypothetical protein NQ315_007700 [Exocentrus adspersus]|uniref:Uncharacterized protein n=1 Tax=Exocentrus adspersus TaxID=1586481 RepID=A0AAV8W8E3_9CUCU|nr:hypothetical protein NQ315_007700 [Exocentrus adspersus]
MEPTNRDDLVKSRCGRTIARNKYERNAPEIRNWWYQLFDILEADAAIKPEKRLPLLRKVFPGRFLQRLKSLISVQDEQFKIDLPEEEQEEEQVEEFQKEKIGSVYSLVPNSGKSTIDPEEKKLCAKEVDTKSSSTPIRERFGETEPQKDNPYLNFFKTKPNRAAIWRELPPLSLEEMNLSQKADAIARAIATNFVEWVKTLGGDQETTISVESVMKMFEIASQDDSTRSIKVQLKEMPSISPKVAEYMRAPEVLLVD